MFDAAFEMIDVFLEGFFAKVGHMARKIFMSVKQPIEVAHPSHTS